MALHLVTGYSGNAHITSADQGAFNAGCVGSDDYVFATGRKFDAEIITSNTIRIHDGSVSMQGRHINLESGTFEDMTISDGVQSMNRNDLIVLRYNKDMVSGVESASLIVIQGVMTDGVAIDPTYTMGDILSGAVQHEMPLYRVRISGVNISSVEPLFRVLTPMADLHHGFYRQNMLINGDFQCNQRGMRSYTVSNTAAYTVDMWRGFQVKVEVLNEGIKLTGRATSIQGYFTQFVQLGKLKTTTYTISAMADDELCTFTVTPGASAKEKNFGKFKISALTTSTWDAELGDYDNKLKINICPIGTSSVTLTYVDVFEGDVVYPHIKEDPATALMRSRQYVREDAGTMPTMYMYTEDSKYAYRFAISYSSMADTATLEGCAWQYYNAAGESTEGTVKDLEVMSNSSGVIQLKTAFKEQKNAQCNGIRAVYLLTCEPTDP